MPVPAALIAGLAVAGMQSGGGIAKLLMDRKIARDNLHYQYWQNLQNQKVEQKRYDQQRADALADWASQNAYNHPLEQMNRLRQAGLNPHLVYGKGADATADAVRSSSFTNVNRPAPQMDMDTSGISQIAAGAAGAFGQIYDFKAKQAQIDNVNQSTALMQQESLFKQANTAKTIQDTAKTGFELGQAQELKDTVIENAKLQNEKLRADTQYTVDNNQRQELANSSNVQLTLEKIISEKIAHAKDNAQIELLKEQLNAVRQTQDIARYEQQLTEMGIYKQDPWYFRAMMNLIHGNMQAPDVIKNSDSWKTLQKWSNRNTEHINNQGFGQGPWNRKK